jgi:DNA mismatch repair protein MutS2
MAHAALPVLAGEGSRVPELDRVEADLGDEQSLDQGLSTFAAHLRSLGAMAEAAGPRTLLLADELGAGTDPEEGAALAQALVEHFAARGAWGIVTTHLGSLKRLAGMIPSIMNGSLGILPEDLTPTYRFVPDVPGASHAISVAERLGLDAALVGRARELVRSEVIRIEELLLELQGLNARLEAERTALATAREEAERNAAEHARGLEAVRQEWEQVTRRLTRESEALTARARELWQSAQRESKKAAKDPGAASRIGEALSAVEAETERLMRAGLEAAGPLGIERPATDRLEPAEVLPGLKVHVANIGVEAEVESSPEADGRVRLRRGGWSIQSHVRELRRLADAPAAPAAKTNGPAASYEASEETALEVDLRGMEVDEALQALDQALDRGVVGGLGEIRIIHGIGRGVLKRAVEKHLGHHPQVGSLRMGQLGEGGRGVSVARLR